MTAEFCETERRYILTERDQHKLYNYNIEYADFLKTTNAIENNVSLRPFDYRQPKWRSFLIRMVSLICMGVYLYCALLIWQMSLFNLIIVAISMIYFNKLWILFSAFEMTVDRKYRTTPFHRFIEAENDRYYRAKNVELIGGEMGEYLDLQMPEDVDDMKKMDAIGERLIEDGIIQERDRKSTHKSINENN